MRLRRLEHELTGRIAVRPQSFMLIPEERTDRIFTDYHRMHRRAAGAQAADAPAFDLPAAGSPYPRSSLPALEAAAWTREAHPAAAAAFDLALYEAFFARTRDISDPEVLVTVAQPLGLDGEKLRAVLRERRLRPRVYEEHAAAAGLGIHAIPAVVIPGRPPIVGAVPYADLRQAVEDALLSRESRTRGV